MCNATIGLMLAIREVIGETRPAERRYALMPSFTFAATAHAAAWCGLTPLFCDIDPETWMLDELAEEKLFQEYADEIAVVVPYATFGNNLNLARYQQISERCGIPVVVDAAASLGSVDENGKAFGAGFRWPIVFSMHATKVFSVGEGGILYCGDTERLGRLRSMSSFGFQGERSATCIGLNAKLSEVSALTALLQLREFGRVLGQRELTARVYNEELGSVFDLQQQVGHLQVRSFQPMLLPTELAPFRDEAIELLRARGIEAGRYFSPHVAEQPFFRRTAKSGPLPVTENIASRVLSLPLTVSMGSAQVRQVVYEVLQVCEQLHAKLQTPFPQAANPATVDRGDQTRAA